ncbi:MAG TPA: bifunctional 4-hydroxy-2-oxoglutarate aldolase/2-dehydro-3-deoxy-phosphogluconate aldolase [Microbacterium sp.]|nr:bifunctional 4-hydroxy-2-oxoglutarate aldolase/2-dehydro-3-deoxy-phosphogluconate aldolase [Microbacterium sp.]
MSALETALSHAPIVAVIRSTSRDDAERMARAAVLGGARVIEITFTVPEADRLIARLRSDLPDVVVGAGTVLTTQQADAAGAADAQFLVSPVFDERVIERGVDLGIPFIPGAFTPTEIGTAAAAGVHAVKVFPARVLGPTFVAATHEVMPDVRLMPTGGIEPDDVAAWLAAGAVAVGIAGALSAAWRRHGAAGVSETTRAAIAAARTRRSDS